MGQSEKGKQTPPPPPEIHRLDPYGCKNLYPSKKPATVIQQLQKSIDFRRSELCECHLRVRPLPPLPAEPLLRPSYLGC